MNKCPKCKHEFESKDLFLECPKCGYKFCGKPPAIKTFEGFRG